MAVMINVSDFFRKHINENDYYNFYFKYIGLVENQDYVYFDENKVMDEFKSMLNPKYESRINPKMTEKFIQLCFYLNQNGYFMKQFPVFLERPGEKCALYDLMYKEARQYILNSREEVNGIVTWDERRKLISDLEFLKKDYVVSSEIDTLFIKISTRSASFMEMADDEKLKEISNVVEYILKNDGKFIDIDFSDCFDILNKDKIISYRKKLNCYRHSSKEALLERKSYNKFQKDMLIRYGIFVVETVYKLFNSKNDNIT